MAVMPKPVLLSPLFECMCPGKNCRCGVFDAVGQEVEPAELAEYPRTLWLDSGSHTGWGIIWFDPDVLFDPEKKASRSHVAWWAGMVIGPELTHTDYIMARLRQEGVGGPGMCVGAESFTVHSVKKDASFLSSPRVTAATEWALHRGQREADGVWRHRTMAPKQSPRDALETFTDERLKLLQMYLPGADHPRDAVRHAALWVRRLKSYGEEFFDRWHFDLQGDSESSEASELLLPPGSGE